MKFSTVDDEVIISLSDKVAWNEVTNKEGLPSNTWTYCNSLVPNTCDNIFLFYSKKNKLFFTFAVRKYLESLDIYSPYGFGGVQSKDLSMMDALITNWACTNQFTTAYLNLAPHIKKPEQCGYKPIYKNRTIYLLGLGNYKSIKQGYSKSIKEKVKSLPEGLALVTNLDPFVDVLYEFYMTTLERVGANKVYYFSKKTIRALINSDLTYGVGVCEGSKLLTASLFLYTNQMADYFLNCTRPSERNYSAYLIDNAIQYFSKGKVKTINLGGGASEGDGLESFKRRFGGNKYTTYIYKKIFDEDKYLNLCKTIENNTTNYFPAYYSL